MHLTLSRQRRLTPAPPRLPQADIDAAHEAVRYLVEASGHTHLTRELRALVDDYRERPMAYAGEHGVLNVLIDIGLKNRHALERLLLLAEQRRKEWLADKERAYQRELMAERRRRRYMAVELRELTHGPFAGAQAKADYLKELQDRWNEAKTSFVLKRNCETYDDKVQAVRDFWAEIDGKLQKSLAEARVQKRH